jgi:hypothetical protein
MSRTTITKAVRELESGKKLIPEGGMIRKPGAGRKQGEEAEEGILEALGEILQETTAGDPRSALRGTHKSTQAMAEELRRRGHDLSDRTVRRCLRRMANLCRLRRKQQQPHPSLEGPSPATRRRNRTSGLGVSLPTRNQPREQNRASALFLSDVARPASAELPNYRESHRRKEDAHRLESASRSRHYGV